MAAGIAEGLSGASPAELLGRAFRANPEYELVLFDRLSAGERHRLEGFRRDPGFYGVLRPRGRQGMGVKAVDRETALLFLTLREPGLLPAYVREVLGEGTARTMAQLLADGILEVEHEGAFVSGPAAFALLPSGPAARRGSRAAAWPASRSRRSATARPWRSTIRCNSPGASTPTTASRSPPAGSGSCRRPRPSGITSASGRGGRTGRSSTASGRRELPWTAG